MAVVLAAVAHIPAVFGFFSFAQSTLLLPCVRLEFADFLFVF